MSDDTLPECERCGAPLVEANESLVVYACLACGARFDQRMNRLSVGVYDG